MRLGQTFAPRVYYVLFGGAPFQIAHLVVGSVAILMINLWQVVGVRDERLGYQPVHLAAIVFIVMREHHGKVSALTIATAWLLGLWHDASNLSAILLHRANTSEVAHLILTIELCDGSPFLNYLFHTLVPLV